MQHAQLESFTARPRGLAALACALLFGCGGMDAYNEEKDEPITDRDDTQSEPPRVLVEECPTLCAIAETDLAPLGCSVDCDIGLGLTYEGDAGVSVLFSLLTIEADGEFQTGGSCDVVVDCGDVSPCTLLAFECLRDSNNGVSHCMEEYVECDAEQHCQDTHTECLVDAEFVLQTCLADPQYTLDECTAAYDDMVAICQCDYDDCLGVSNPDCEHESPPPMPLLTAPGARDVSRRFVHHHLDRLVGLDTEIFAMVVPDATGHARGIQLRSITPGDALHALGLRDGDIVLTVNGRPVLDGLHEPMQFLALLERPGTTIVVRRNGTNVRLSYRFVP